MNLKPLLLILGYMFKHEAVKDPVFAESMDQIRKVTPQLTSLLLGVT
jgi:hypothetical protein